MSGNRVADLCKPKEVDDLLAGDGVSAGLKIHTGLNHAHPQARRHPPPHSQKPAKTDDEDEPEDEPEKPNSEVPRCFRWN
jgi:hypothetical protein